MLGKGPGRFLARGHSLPFPSDLSVSKTPFQEQVFDSRAQPGRSEGFRGHPRPGHVTLGKHITSLSCRFSSFGRHRASWLESGNQWNQGSLFLQQSGRASARRTYSQASPSVGASVAPGVPLLASRPRGPAAQWPHGPVMPLVPLHPSLTRISSATAPHPPPGVRKTRHSHLVLTKSCENQWLEIA